MPINKPFFVSKVRFFRKKNHCGSVKLEMKYRHTKTLSWF